MHIETLAEMDSADLPPIVVHRSTMRVIDGMHRLRAAERRGNECIDVRFFDGSEDEAFVCSVEMNMRHGLPLPLADRKSAARRILIATPSMSDRAIAAVTGLSAKTVATVRRTSVTEASSAVERIGADGRRRPVEPYAGRRRARELLLQSPHLTVRALAAQAGISLGTAHAVRKELLSTDHAVAPRGRQEAELDRDPDLLIGRLRTDPVVRFNESGRRLIRSLQAASVNAAELVELSADIPQHCVPLVSQLAVRQAAIWTEFARRLSGNFGNGTAELQEFSA
ncbi:streptomycin biosynthesis protein [Nocardia cyriacigeorgica]|uniref:Streptomycin biosynthesis protein n=1 Tax=Nocardia cyriacigeorgica TaxID=135487 RepID=A0A5R8PCU9_9NOCA|nr:streptomycin biosynthesis protein [Nocardia cyriacigeorgica]